MKLMSARIFSLAMFVSSLFLLLGLNSPVCGESIFLNCGKVLSSPLSSFLGVPLPWVGLIISILALIRVNLVTGLDDILKHLICLNAIFAAVLLLYQGYLGSFCPYCLVYDISSIFLPWVLPGKERRFSFFVLISFLFILAGGVYWSFNNKPEVKVYESNGVVITDGIKIYGGEGNLVRLDIFSDFQCPGCKRANMIIREIGRQFDIDIYYHFFPLDSQCNSSISLRLHPLSCTLAAMSLCSSNFKNFHDQVFREQYNLGEEFINELKNSYQIQDSCIVSSKTMKRISSDIDLAKNLGIDSTPSMFIQGKRYNGILEYGEFKAFVLSFYGEGNE